MTPVQLTLFTAAPVAVFTGPVTIRLCGGRRPVRDIHIKGGRL